MNKQSDEDIECTSDDTIGQQSSGSVQYFPAKKKPKLSMTDIYERDSMEMFGDDLTERILQYLWLKDKVKFQYVCKQWQRLIYNKQKTITISCIEYDYKKNLLQIHKQSDKQFNRELMESVLKKCPNISRVYLWSSDIRSGTDNQRLSKSYKITG